MNIRAAFLLVLFLLVQAGQGLAWDGPVWRPDGSDGVQPCHLSCCHALTAAHGCCCLEDGNGTPAVPTPVPPPSTERDQVPPPVWVWMTLTWLLSGHKDIPAAVTLPEFGVPSCATRGVALPVLHRAFLI